MFSQAPTLSIIIPWCDRQEIEATVQHNRPIFAAYNAEVLIVNCGGNVAWLRDMLAQQDVPWLRCVEIESVTFNKSLALNLGVFVSRAPRLFFLDTDVLLQKDFLSEALERLDNPCFVTVDRVFESGHQRSDNFSQLREIAYVVELVGRRNRKVRIETNRLRFGEGSRSGPGLIMLRREHFLEVNGMNSDLEGWGWEDLDLLARLQFALHLRWHKLGSVVHLTHSQEQRTFGGSTPAADQQTNFTTCLANYSIGHYLGTYDEDVTKWHKRLMIFSTA